MTTKEGASVRKGKLNFSTADVAALLDVRRPVQNQTSLKVKFGKHVYTKKSTGDPSCPLQFKTLLHAPRMLPEDMYTCTLPPGSPTGDETAKPEDADADPESPLD
eukprot:IDg19783t1